MALIKAGVKEEGKPSSSKMKRVEGRCSAYVLSCQVGHRLEFPNSQHGRGDFRLHNSKSFMGPVLKLARNTALGITVKHISQK